MSASAQDARWRGTFAAALTPLRRDGARLDKPAYKPMVDLLVQAGVSGILAFGTTGEGILLTATERRRALEYFVEAAEHRISVIAQCGAQTTRETVSLCGRAGEIGADAVAVIGPPYFAPDEEALFSHFLAAARACSPLPFFIYEFAARTGYPVPPTLLARLREKATNFIGLKVSDRPWEALAPYMIEGLRVFVGSEGLIHKGLAAGASGSVSALASALPELVVAAVATGSEQDSQRCTEARAQLERFPFHSALKTLLAARGVPIHADVRGPLRPLTRAEQSRLRPSIATLIADAERCGARERGDPAGVNDLAG